MTHAHDHRHSPDCEHKLIAHGDHHDFMHDGHLHHVDGDTVTEHVIDVDADHPDVCTPDHACHGHEQGHAHAETCGHAPVPHGDQVDYLVDGHLHFPHGDHCDNHGRLVA